MIYSKEILLSDIGSPLTFVFPDEANVYKYELDYVPQLCENFPMQIRISQALYNSTNTIRLDIRDKFRLVNSFYFSKSKLSDGYYYATSNILIGTEHKFVWFELYAGNELLADTTIPYTDNVIFWELNPVYNDPLKTLSYSNSKNKLNVVFNESLYQIDIPSRNSKLISAKILINKTGGSGGGTTPTITSQWADFVCEDTISGLLYNGLNKSYQDQQVTITALYNVTSYLTVYYRYTTSKGNIKTVNLIIPPGSNSATESELLEEDERIDSVTITAVYPEYDSTHYYDENVTVNTGYARYYSIALSNGANYSALNSFGSYQNITDNQLKNISLADYIDRMNAFCLYVESLVSGLTISREYRGINLTSCPI